MWRKNLETTNEEIKNPQMKKLKSTNEEIKISQMKKLKIHK